MRQRAIAAATVVALALAAWFAVGRDARPGLERAADLLDDPGRFDTGLESGETLARVGALLLDDARRCRDDHGPVVRCQARSSASAVAQVFAVEVLQCSAPGRFEARTRLAAYLDEVAAAGSAVPEPPDPPSC